MNIMLLGAAGFIGTNLTIRLAENKDNNITLVDVNRSYFSAVDSLNLKNVNIKALAFTIDMDFEALLKDQDVIYHLVSTTVPTTSNQHIADEITSNVVFTVKLLDACIKCNVRKVVFISSGGTVYGKEDTCPLGEDTVTNPICSYGIQKVTIEKLLYLYQYLYGLDYRVIRLANPYGPYQRPNGVQGVVTTFTYKALMNEEISVYGDGSVVRDFIYIDDAVRGIMNIADGESKYRVFNLGCGYGTSIRKVLEIIQSTLDIDINVVYKPGRKVDVPVNYLDISRYEKVYGPLKPISLSGGIKKTSEFMKNNILRSI